MKGKIGIAFDGVVVLAVTMVVILACTYAWPEDRFGMAAWVQAIGSVGAIIGAVLVMKWQSQEAAQLAQKMDDRALARRLSAVESIVEHAYNLSEVLRVRTQPVNDYHDYFFSNVSPEDIDTALNALSEIPLHTLESFKMVRAVQQIRQKLQRLQPYVESFWTSKDPDFTFEGHDAEMVSYRCKQIRYARELFRESIIELGHTPTDFNDHVVPFG